MAGVVRQSGLSGRVMMEGLCTILTQEMERPSMVRRCKRCPIINDTCAVIFFLPLKALLYNCNGVASSCSACLVSSNGTGLECAWFNPSDSCIIDTTPGVITDRQQCPRGERKTYANKYIFR